MGLKTQVLLDPDGGLNISQLSLKTKGAYHLKLISSGIASHGSTPWNGKNALDNLLKTIENLRKYFPYIDNENIPEDKWIPTMNIGKISGGKSTNVVCDYAELCIDIRFTENLNKEKINDILNKCLVGKV